MTRRPSTPLLPTEPFSSLLFRSFSMVLIFILSFEIGSAGTARISGYVKSANSNHPVQATITLTGTYLGASTDTSGYYTIVNVTPGTYQVRASAVGFVTERVERLVVSEGVSMRLNFALKDTAIGLAEFVVEAGRPLLEQSQTTAASRFDWNELSSLPIREVTDAFDLVPGAFRGYMRGGSPNLTKTVVDGVDITDEYSGWLANTTPLTALSPAYGVMDVSQAMRSASSDVPLQSVDQSNVFLGGYSPEYGGTSGVVSHFLKEGHGRWSGSVSVRISQLGGLNHLGPNVYADRDLYFQRKAALLASQNPWDRQQAAFFTWTPEKYEYGGKPQINSSLSLGGSLSAETGLYLTAEWFDSHGRLPNEWTRQFNASAKLTHSITPGIKLKAFALLQDRGQILGWKNRAYSEVLRYFLEGVPQWDGYNVVGGITFSHTISPTTSYEIQASFTRNTLRRGFCDDNHDGVILPYENGEFITWQDTAEAYRYIPYRSSRSVDRFFALQGSSVYFIPSTLWISYAAAFPPFYYESTSNQTFSLRWSGTSLITEHHLLKGGIEARFHGMDKTLRTSAGYGYFPEYKSYLEEIWTRHPREYILYLQDNIEVEGLYVNLGMRAQLVDLDASNVVNWFDPYAQTTDASGGPVIVPRRDDPIPLKTLVSPRIGVSHPIRHDASMYFSFSRSQQFLPYSFLYANYNNPVSVTMWQSNTVREPITTSSVDLGIQWALTSTSGAVLNAYFKEISNGGSRLIQIIPRSGAHSWITTNAQVLDCRGVELTFKQDRINLLGVCRLWGRANYAFSYAKALAFTDNAWTLSTVAGDSARYATGIPFEQVEFDRKTFVNIPGGSFFTGGYDRKHRFTFQMSLDFPGDIMLSAYGKFASGFYYFIFQREDLRNIPQSEGPWNKQVDLRIQKGFALSGIGHFDIFVDILNAFNWTNVIAYQWLGVTQGTGQLAWERTQDPTGGPDVNRPTNVESVCVYDIPREVYFGVRLSF